MVVVIIVVVIETVVPFIILPLHILTISIAMRIISIIIVIMDKRFVNAARGIHR